VFNHPNDKGLILYIMESEAIKEAQNMVMKDVYVPKSIRGRVLVNWKGKWMPYDEFTKINPSTLTQQ
tara:strand:- start:846 stop:1046 length:201 start_codon:yes stop_codon:yes gene_type:complete